MIEAARKLDFNYTFFVGNEGLEHDTLINYASRDDFKEKALFETLQFLNANVYGYSFLYRSESALMKTEEVFELDLLGKIKKEQAPILSEDGIAIYTGLSSVTP